MIEELNAILFALNLAFGMLNTWWAWRRTCYNRDVLKGSLNYWAGWKERSKDIASKVLEDISTKDLKSELKKRRGN